MTNKKVISISPSYLEDGSIPELENVAHIAVGLLKGLVFIILELHVADFSGREADPHVDFDQRTWRHLVVDIFLAEKKIRKILKNIKFL